MTHPKIQHYVPQFLLRAFEAEAGSGQVHVFDKKTSGTFRTNVTNVAAEKGFNDFEFEGVTLTFEPVLQALEDEMAPIATQIVERGQIGFLTAGERDTVARFVLAQNMRTRHFVDSVHDAGIQLARVLEERDPGAPERLGFSADPETSRLIAFNLLQKSTDLVPFILDKAWGLYEAHAEHPFMLADHPVVMQNNVNKSDVRGTIGLGVEGIEIYLPISPTYCLGFICQSLREMTIDAYAKSLHAKTDLGIELPAHDQVGWLRDGLEYGFSIPSSPENVEYLNSLQIRYAERFVFSSDGRFGLVKEMISEDPEVRHGPRMSVN